MRQFWLGRGHPVLGADPVKQDDGEHWDCLEKMVRSEVSKLRMNSSIQERMAHLGFRDSPVNWANVEGKVHEVKRAVPVQMAHLAMMHSTALVHVKSCASNCFNPRDMGPRIRSDENGPLPAGHASIPMTYQQRTILNSEKLLVLYQFFEH